MLVVLLLLRWLFPSELTGIHDWIVLGFHPSGWTLIATTLTAFVELMTALAIMLVTWTLFADLLYGKTEAWNESAWEKFLQYDDLSARVYLRDGTSWVGKVRSYSVDNKWDQREIVISDPRRVDSNGVASPAYIGRIIIPSIEIVGVFTAGDDPTAVNKA